MSSQVSKPSRRACRRCRIQKRQCDKALPLCSLCSHLGHICSYEEPVAASCHIYPLLDPVASIDINNAITNKAFAFVSSESDLRDHVARYFNTIHTWLPVISQQRYYRRLSSFLDGQNPGFSLLTLSIILISTVPQTPGTPLYLSTKSFIGVLEGMGINSLDLLQTRLLVTIFEVGHGYLQAGNISIGAVTRAAMTSGSREKQHVQPSESAEEGGIEEGTQVWCGILVLDRYIALENGRGPTATKGHTFTNQLQSNNKEWGKSERCLQFSRLTEASYLVDRILNAMYEPTAQKSFNLEEVTTIMIAVNSFKAILKDEAFDEERTQASSLVLLNSALLALHDFGIHVDPSDRDYAQCRSAALTASTKVLSEVLRMAKELKSETSAPKLDCFPPFLSFMIYKAAIIVLERQRAGDASMFCVEALDCFISTLKLISQRWLAAKQYLQALEDL